MDCDMPGRQQPIPIAVFARALCETVATMTGITLDQSEETGAPADVKDEGRRIWGAMVLPGEQTAVLLLDVDWTSAIELLTCMTGVDSTEITDRELYDGVLEMVNMTAGMAKAYLAGSKAAFCLSTPFALAGLETKLLTKRNVAGSGARFSSATVQLGLKLFYV